MAAASKGHKEVIKVLLKHRADILPTSYDVSVVFPDILCTMYNNYVLNYVRINNLFVQE